MIYAPNGQSLWVVWRLSDWRKENEPVITRAARKCLSRKHYGPRPKFNEQTIHNIRTARGKIVDIAAKFKISVGYASKIRNGKRRTA